MSLLDDVNNLSKERSQSGPRCGMEILFKEIKKEEQLAIMNALGNPRLNAAQIARALTRNGHPVNSRTITRHRRRGTSDGCRCPE